MPTYEITSPDGQTYEVTAPEGATEQEVMAYAQSNYGAPEPVTEPQVAQQQQPTQNEFEGGLRSAVQGLTLGFGDELTAGVGAIPQAMITGQSIPQAYKEIMQGEAERIREFKEQSPWVSGVSEVGGALGSAVATAPLMGTKLLTEGGRVAQGLKAAGLGGVSGGAYAFGTGEGDARERFENVPTSAAIGATGGLVGLGIAKGARPLTERAKALFTKSKPTAQLSRQSPTEVVAKLAEKQQLPAVIDDVPSAYGKVAKQLGKDFGEDLDIAMEAYKKGDISLSELYGNRTSSLAQGAAVYPAGRGGAEDFLNKKASGSYERVLSSIKSNISGVDNYFTTADDLLNAGRAKARPQYQKAYQDSIEDTTVLQIPEIQDALKKAYKEFPSRLQGVPETSIEALDYAKRVLDDQIGVAQRAGKGNFASSRIDVKNQLLDAMDAASPSYREARGIAGDYLSVNNAMESGRKALKVDSETLDTLYKGLSAQEQQAYKIGLGKAIRDEVGKVAEGANPYKRILGSPEKQKRIASVLSPEEYINFEKGLKAEDRLFQFRNKVLGGSPTADKLEAQNLIESGAVQSLTGVPQATFTDAIKKFGTKLTDGLNDKTAAKVSDILYETDPVKKLMILDKLRMSKNFTKQERELVERSYALIAPKYDSLKLTPAFAGGSIASPRTTGEQ